MSTHTIHARHHRLSGRGAALAVAGTALAASAGYGVFTWVTDDPRVTAPAQDLPAQVDPDGVRDSWEGRIGPDAGKSGRDVRDPQMPPAWEAEQRRLKLEQLQ